MQIGAWLERAAAKHPGRVAVETPEGAWTYAELLAAARVGAAALSERGAAPGERVAIALPAGLEFAQALHACMLLGAAAVPVDLRLAAAERGRIAAAGAVLVQEPLPLDGALLPAGARHDLDAIALVVHTSGTTAAPRPVELSYGNMLWSALGSGVALGVQQNDRWLCALPLSHVGGLSILIRSAIYATTAVVHERFETDRALAALRTGDVTLVSLVATTLARLLDAGLERPPALRCALTGGGPVAPALRERALAAGVPVSLTYGLTETCSQATTLPAAALDDPAHTAGPPLFCTRLRLAADGEIMLAGPTVARSARLDGGFLATGDLGRLDERGWLRVIGRKADTIVTGGENVAPAEVEAVLEAHPDVVEAAVVGRPHDQWGEMVSAWVVTAPGARLDWDDLVAHCRAGLAPYKVPKDFRASPDPLPRTASGKLLRRELA
ncbi:MAG TPA: AMP-binding protein [Solirubrobacteraceae bacterium]|jgi:O-succinylbenzoic acid--CoA ligase|nr:AMP-binding protein [Solirubrobacteraceae bacterium]